MIIPPYLKPGDTVAIVCTARKFFPEDAEPAIALLKSWGLEVKLGRTIGLDSCQLGGTDRERIDDFQQMMDDDNIKAIWCARGGYGTVRIIDGLDFTKFKKPFWFYCRNWNLRNARQRFARSFKPIRNINFP